MIFTHNESVKVFLSCKCWELRCYHVLEGHQCDCSLNVLFNPLCLYNQVQCGLWLWQLAIHIINKGLIPHNLDLKESVKRLFYHTKEESRQELRTCYEVLNGFSKMHLCLSHHRIMQIIGDPLMHICMYLVVPIFLRKILVTSVQWLCSILEHSWSEKTQPVDWWSSALHFWLVKLANFPISYIIKASYVKTWLLSDESDYLPTTNNRSSTTQVMRG